MINLKEIARVWWTLYLIARSCYEKVFYREQSWIVTKDAWFFFVRVLKEEIEELIEGH